MTNTRVVVYRLDHQLDSTQKEGPDVMGTIAKLTIVLLLVIALMANFAPTGDSSAPNRTDREIAGLVTSIQAPMATYLSGSCPEVEQITGKSCN